MCGIAGIVARGDAAERHVQGMLATLRHRGPDDCAIRAAGGAVLGVARLALIDFASSRQPLASRDGSLVLAFNGELLNFVELRELPDLAGFRFRTRGDTEVVLAMLERMGTRALPLFNGQFAGALWDRRRESLTLFRDRFGIIPLHYAATNVGFAFASTATPLLELPGVDRSFDLEALRQVLTFWAPRAPVTAARGVRQVPPGSVIEVHDGRLRTRRWWQPDFDGGERRVARPEVAVHDALQAAVRRGMRADDGVACLVSGGVDSAAIAAFAGAHRDRLPGRRLQSYSIGFECTPFDEGAHQRRVVHRVQSSHTTVRCADSEIADVLQAVVEASEVPLLRLAPCSTYLLGKRLHTDGIKTVLSGEGADELLCGYGLFRRTAGLGVGQKMPTAVRRLLEQPRFASHAWRWGTAMTVQRYLAPGVLEGTPNPIDVLADDLTPEFDGLTAPARAQWLELTTLLPGYLLSSQADRVLMAHAVEARFPFLDNEVSGLALRLPMAVKLDLQDGKRVLRRAMTPRLGKQIALRPKQGYRAPVVSVLRTALGAELVGAFLDKAAIERHGIFDSGRLGQLVEALRCDASLDEMQEMALVAALTTHLWIEFVSRRGSA